MYMKILEICLEKYQLDPVYFVSAPGLAWQACLKILVQLYYTKVWKKGKIMLYRY